MNSSFFRKLSVSSAAIDVSVIKAAISNSFRSHMISDIKLRNSYFPACNLIRLAF